MVSDLDRNVVAKWDVNAYLVAPANIMKLTRTFREQFGAYVGDTSTLVAYENVVELMLNHIQDFDLEEGIKKGFERSLLAAVVSCGEPCISSQ